MEDYSEQDSHNIASPTEEPKSVGTSCCSEFPLSLLEIGQPCQAHPDLHKIIQVRNMGARLGFCRRVEWNVCFTFGISLLGKIPGNWKFTFQAGAIKSSLFLLLPTISQERGRHGAALAGTKLLPLWREVALLGVRSGFGAGRLMGTLSPWGAHQQPASLPGIILVSALPLSFSGRGISGSGRQERQ